jgi:DNA-binding SARP family transcriptional activator/tetratricopeptide (TPR) repeat protein
VSVSSPTGFVDLVSWATHGGAWDRLLGDVEVWHAGRQISLGAKQRAVLAVLAFQANTVVDRSKIVRLAWGDDPDGPPVTIDRLVTDYVSRLRTTLREAGADEATRLITHQPGYVLETDPATVDWYRFRDLVSQARVAQQASDVDDAARLLRRALGMWRGPALANVPGQSLDPIRAQMMELRLASAEDLAEAELARGAAGELLSELDELATAYPGRERLAALLVHAFVAAGSRDQAITVYKRTRAHLTDELGLSPGDALEQAYQAVLHGHDQIRTPAKAAVRLAQLPADTANFTGRAGELAQLLATLSERPVSDAVSDTPDQVSGGVVVICAVDGMAGVGKTALAVHAAHQLADRFDDGCLFLDLRGYTHQLSPVEPGQALERLLRSLGVPGEQIPHHIDDQAALYRNRLAGTRTLIVLDNARTADQVRPLLPADPGCLVLVTSRRRLTALDEALPISLDVLPVSDALALFSSIAGPGRITGNFADAEAASRVVELCGRLPLALRIAAARLRARPAWTMRHLADRLADQHDRLTELDDGERSVTAAFALSYCDLTVDQQRMFRRLGLHPGTDIGLPAAAALTSTTVAKASRLLEDLLDANLLIQASAGRYRLHDLVRTYAAHCVDQNDADQNDADQNADERRTALTALFDYYRSTAAAAIDILYTDKVHHRPRVSSTSSLASAVCDTASARAWLDSERHNLVAACAYAAVHGWPGHATRLATTIFRYLDQGGHYSEGLAIHSHARTAAAALNDRSVEAHALTSLGHVYVRQGHHDRAADNFRQAIILFHEAGDSPGKARALTHLGGARWRLGHYWQASHDLLQALAIQRDAGDGLGEARALHNLGLVRWRQGRYPEAEDHNRRALALARAAGHRVLEANALGNLGVLCAWQGRYGEAISHLQQVLEFSLKTGTSMGEAYVLTNLGSIYLWRGQPDKAIKYHREALALFRQNEDLGGECEALNGMGEALCATGQPALASTQHFTALTLALKTGYRYEQGRAHAGIARAHEITGEKAQARRQWQNALTLYTKLDVPDADDVRAHLAGLDSVDSAGSFDSAGSAGSFDQRRSS